VIQLSLILCPLSPSLSYSIIFDTLSTVPLLISLPPLPYSVCKYSNVIKFIFVEMKSCYRIIVDICCYFVQYVTDWNQNSSLCFQFHSSLSLSTFFTLSIHFALVTGSLHFPSIPCHLLLVTIPGHMVTPMHPSRRRHTSPSLAFVANVDVKR